MSISAPLPIHDQLEAAGAVKVLAGCDPESDQALAAFDAAISVVSPDEDLLSGAPARELMSAMASVVKSLRTIDAERVARRQGWFARFTGADIEARLEFELAIKSVSDQMHRLATSASAARHARNLMDREIAKLDASFAPNEALIMETRELLHSGPVTPDAARLQRRLANLEALHASNQLSRAQAMLAINNVVGLLDRYTEIQNLLYPVWQQHALAVAQGAVAPEELPAKLASLEIAQSRFDQALRSSEIEG